MSTPDDNAPQPTLGQRVTRMLGAVSGDPLARAELDMARVLEELKLLGAEPIEDLTPEEARRQPSAADAARSLLAKMGVAPHDDRVASHDVTFPGADGELPARIYRPEGAGAGLPTIVYFHGGGWVYGGLDDYDASPRAIAERTGSLVLSAHYRLAPEHKFPAAHDDAVAAWRWALQSAKAFGGDGERFAVMGESAGGNLALNVAIAARDRMLTPPLHMALVYPIAGSDLATPSYRANETARPLNKAMMLWYFGHALLGPAERDDPRIDLVGRADLSRLPPATLVTAEIDPLRSEGHALAEKLRAAGSAVTELDVEGVTHGFFGLGDIVRHARSAQDLVARDLAAAFAGLA
ncbi:alpha/beta hydrolase [Hansschlegelia plantiphila]|uniref:Acetylhydrolase n=1 Tax=Hansschlegelia plantiphila TaxID=374655 RepID=A0A9W6MUV5_9HYPH|nr:alpha/beta hydrolase [Hansschlegelia plantiphila]GLK67090.1 acetylhydrolase [Hansschlegelia plantiphila]